MRSARDHVVISTLFPDLRPASLATLARLLEATDSLSRAEWSLGPASTCTIAGPMCGRYTLSKASTELAELFHVERLPEEQVPRFNIAPTERVLVIQRGGDAERPVARLARWGFVPPKVRRLEGERGVINARSETVFELPLYEEHD